MNTYVYTALKDDELHVKGSVKAGNQKKAVAKLESEGLLVINIKKEAGNYWGDKQIFSTISRLEKIYFTRHLHNFLESGISLSEAIKIAAEQMTNKKFQEILWDIFKKVTSGQSLNSALASHKRYFSNYFIQFIKVGEESGTMDATLKHLLEQQEKDYELLSNMRGALIYPIIICTAAIIMVIFMMTFVIPTIVGVLTEYGTDLPLPTKIMIFMSNFLVRYGWFVLAAFIALTSALVMAIKKSAKAKWHLESFLFSLPLIGKIMTEFNIARFARSMSAPLLSGLSIDRALELANDTCDNVHFKRSIEDGVKFVRKGIPVSEVMIGYPKIYSADVTRMIQIGEKTGRVDHMFMRVATFYERSVANTFKNISTVIEPFLLVGIGLVVGFVAVSILTPIWKLTDTF